jgi:RNA polymerase sigma-70 factor (ECF subfamily)
MITKFHNTNTCIVMAAALLTTLGMGMLANAQTDNSASTATSENPNVAPHIIATSPKVGTKDVDPKLKEITVTFDRDMTRGMSWTGGGPDYPDSPDGARAHWRDSRTCVLPVKLQPGHHYRVGINSMSYHNFCGVNGLPAAISAITFTTSGTAVKQIAPKVVSLSPPNGARDVSPSVTELRVTFNIRMGGGMSWCGGGPAYPASPAGKDAYWTEHGKTCVLPVELKPGSEYELGLNSPSYKNFRSATGVPLSPVLYTFKTSDKP